jgi:hypothetical protein
LVRITRFNWLSTRSGVGLGRAGDAERTDAFTVQREALRETGRDEEVEAGVDELADHRAVLDDAVAEALVGEVEERHQAVRPDRVG